MGNAAGLFSRFKTILLVVLALSVFTGCKEQGQQEAVQDTAFPRAGVMIRPFSIKDLKGGAVIKTDSLIGKPFVINFWASWCGPCSFEAPGLEKMYRTFRDRGVEFVGVVVQDREEPARGFQEKYGLSFPSGLDETGDISFQYNVYGVPMTLVVAGDGRISYVHIGAIEEDVLKGEIQKVL